MDNTNRTEQSLGNKTNFGTINLSDGVLNNSEEKITENIRTNIRRGLPQLQRFKDQDKPVALVAGGPSLNSPESFEDLMEHVGRGYGVVALNGSYKWLDEQGIKYHAHVLLDSREFNKRFVENPKQHVKYFVCSQCDPAVFDALDGYETYIWHGGTCKFCLEDMDEVYNGKYERVRTGRTVVLGALYVFRILGFSKFELFGFDSCLVGNNDHHAYHQPENDMDTVVEFEINGRKFRCHPWMIGQAQDFIKMTKHLGHKFDINIHGDGLISWIIETIAERGELVYTEANEWDNVVAHFVGQQ